MIIILIFFSIQIENKLFFQEKNKWCGFQPFRPLSINFNFSSFRNILREVIIIVVENKKKSFESGNLQDVEWWKRGRFGFIIACSKVISPSLLRQNNTSWKRIFVFDFNCILLIIWIFITKILITTLNIEFLWLYHLLQNFCIYELWFD